MLWFFCVQVTIDLVELRAHCVAIVGPFAFILVRFKTSLIIILEVKY